mgnify:CR=1 FL=1
MPSVSAMRRLLHGTASVWKREEGSSVLFGFLVLNLFVVPFLRAWFPRLAPVSTVALVLLFIVGVLVVFPSTWAKLVACFFAGSAIALPTRSSIRWRSTPACRGRRRSSASG